MARLQKECNVSRKRTVTVKLLVAVLNKALDVEPAEIWDFNLRNTMLRT